MIAMSEVKIVLPESDVHRHHPVGAVEKEHAWEPQQSALRTQTCGGRRVACM